MNKFKKTEVMQNIFSDHKGVKLESMKKHIWKITKYLEIKNNF